MPARSPSFDASRARSIPPFHSIYLVARNHNVENEPTKESLRAYRETFGPDWYSFRQGDVYGIVLNSKLIDAPEEVPGEARDQLAWLRKELVRAESSDAPIQGSRGRSFGSDWP
jgi:hypothetical protein